LTKDQIKKLHQNKSWLFYVLDLDDSDEDSTIDYETLVPQYKDSLYYPESKEVEILYWKKEWQRFAIRKTTWNFCRQ
jgi:hypothetical protein